MKLKLKKYMVVAHNMAKTIQKLDDIESIKTEALKLEGYLRACQEMFEGNTITIIEVDSNIFHND